MRLRAQNGVVIDAMEAAVARLLESGFTPVRENPPTEGKTKATTPRKGRTTKK